MNLTKRQLEFWTVLLVLCIAVSVTILLIDFGIKAAILEESTRLRLKIEEETNGRGTKATNTDRTDNDPANNSAISVPLLVDESAGMETENVPNGTTAKATGARNRRRTQPSRQADAGTIPNGNEQVG